jgi:hypothetical protein
VKCSRLPEDKGGVIFIMDTNFMAGTVVVLECSGKKECCKVSGGPRVSLGAYGCQIDIYCS